MANLIIPKMKQIPEGATLEERGIMFEEYREELIRLNPQAFNRDGSVKSIWGSIKDFFKSLINR